MRLIVPPLTSQYLNLVKNSSLAVFVGYPDLVQIFAGTVLNQTQAAVQVMAITMAVYLDDLDCGGCRAERLQCAFRLEGALSVTDAIAFVRDAVRSPSIRRRLLSRGALAWARANLFSSRRLQPDDAGLHRARAVAAAAACPLGDGGRGLERAGRRALPRSIRTAPAGRSSAPSSTTSASAPIRSPSAGGSNAVEVAGRRADRLAPVALGAEARRGARCCSSSSIRSWPSSCCAARRRSACRSSTRCSGAASSFRC